MESTVLHMSNHRSGLRTCAKTCAVYFDVLCDTKEQLSIYSSIYLYIEILSIYIIHSYSYIYIYVQKYELMVYTKGPFPHTARGALPEINLTGGPHRYQSYPLRCHEISGPNRAPAGACCLSLAARVYSHGWHSLGCQQYTIYIYVNVICIHMYA